MSAKMMLPCGHEVDRPISFQETVRCPDCGVEYVLVWVRKRMDPPVRRRVKLTERSDEERRRQLRVWEAQRRARIG